MTVNMAVNKKGNNNNSAGFGRDYPQNQNFNNGGRSGNPSQGGRRGLGKKSYYNNTGRPQCQICYRVVHAANRCYYRYKQNFQSQDNTQHQGNNNNKNSGSMTAMVATPDTVADQHWYIDSGATDHCTPDAQNLMHKTKYQGKKRIFKGNDTGSSFEESYTSRCP
ncbi:hypothetical protein ACOSQ4_028268 [Xanthoceras sorbifolium]